MAASALFLALGPRKAEIYIFDSTVGIQGTSTIDVVSIYKIFYIFGSTVGVQGTSTTSLRGPGVVAERMCLHNIASQIII